MILILIAIIGFANAARITVAPKGADYSKIQGALNNASDGDVIEVQSGRYVEHVYILHSVSLIGVDTGSGRPVIDANGSSSAITLRANGTRIEGFNLTGSGGCGCGNAGIFIDSSNDFLGNRVAANDTVGNRWSMEMKEEGLMGLLKGAKVIGNHYSDYDEPGEGCNDTNSDGFCDEPRMIRNGPGIDEHPLVAPIKG
ncbi:hypothetical protein [Methanothrix sp.]|uniref:right-handed parallel beta-helix repeat-containing protein n=1 Tax=Methanothrix sp. TaxID=90426 RepID=UPI0032969179